ncbi:GNAT family N-acetyltransferase [uncultured Microbacterium sp.]|uniref:GNAT family N-acetyltransferase n=1 Tax=uncultured Microbacterium sp. TaxID=191216 RepID=UPI0028D2E898|nr:GNAT family N-acetyltransferase [uncultured Microbacterium sp.]
MPVQLIPLDDDRFDEWRDATRARLIRLRQESGILLGDDAVAEVDAFLTQLLPAGRATETSSIVRIADGDRELGTLWMMAAGGILHLVDLALVEAIEQRILDELFDVIATIARTHAVERLRISLYSTDVAGRAFVEGRGFDCASIRMLLEPVPSRGSTTAPLELTRMTEERFAAFAAESEEAFAADLVASGRYSEDEARTESRRQMALELPDGLDSAGQELFTAQVDGTEVGVLWLGIRDRDGEPHVFILDIEVGAEHRRRGFGRAMMLATEHEARRVGAGSIGLHVFGFNDGAIRLYEGLGYRRVEERFHLDLSTQ